MHRFGEGVGALSTACLLYTGAALAAVVWPRREGAEAKVGRLHLPRLALVAISGSVLAPTAFAWGLQHADATGGSLILNFEAIFTVLLARVFFGEAVHRRVAVAVALMAVGGFALVFAGPHGAPGASWGLAAVALATLAWAADNTLIRPLSSLDPMAVVAHKALLGAGLTALLAVSFREPLPGVRSALGLLACGAVAYGPGLGLYLLAQRRMGAARTASVFAIAPFVGAVLAWAMGDGEASAATLVAGVLFAVAVALHLSESHGHLHTHDAKEHEHAHRHDEPHHDHVHDPPTAGVHSHLHRHDTLTHDHPHAPDEHHAHRH